MALPEEKVLLVDDEPRLLAGLRRRLSDRFHILTAESADEAIQALEANARIGAVLTDMRMPGRDGIDLLMEVSTRWPNIRRLMLTGNNDQDTAMAAVNRGRVFRFFRKPCDADQIAMALSEALDEFRFVSGSQAEREALEIRARAGARSRKAFLSTMSHELLTPLNHILGFSSMLELKLRDKQETEALEYLAYIKDSGETLLRLVQRVLEIVRYTSGDPGRPRRLTDVPALIEEELNQFRSRAELGQIEISFQSPPGPVFAYTSEYELRFVLRELLDNAAKFNRPDGQISVALGHDGTMLTIRVADTGIGMAPETVSRALGLFSQGDETITRGFGGVGLGLTFAAFYARANKGRVTIESEKHAGTAVMVTLPIAEHPPELVRFAG
jgi:signal transduction histidine kinase